MRLYEIEDKYLEPTSKNIKLAKDFVFEKWKERQAERFMVPNDLSYSCKFSSMFAQRIFGGTIKGNYDHQFVVLPDGNILDLNYDAEDVKKLGDKAYKHDPKFFGKGDHKKSMKSCEPRVNRWVEEFKSLYELS